MAANSGRASTSRAPTSAADEWHEAQALHLWVSACIRSLAAAASADGTGKDAAGKDIGIAVAPTSSGGQKSIAERDAEYKKRQADAAEKAKKDQEATAEAQRRETTCRGLRQNLTSLENGQRMRKLDDKGEPYFVDDAERAKDISRIRQEMVTAKCG